MSGDRYLLCGGSRERWEGVETVSEVNPFRKVGSEGGKGKWALPAEREGQWKDFLWGL